MRGRLGRRVRHEDSESKLIGEGESSGHAKRQRDDNESRGTHLSASHVATARWSSVSWYPPNGWQSGNRRRRRPVSMLLSHHRYPLMSSHVIVDLSWYCITPKMTNNQSVVVRHLVATSLWAMWHLGCVCHYGNGREGIAQLTCIVDAGDGCLSPFVIGAVSHIADPPHV